MIDVTQFILDLSFFFPLKLIIKKKRRKQGPIF